MNVATRSEWQVARGALREREEKLYRPDEEPTRERRELPWVAVEGCE
jgi:predicted dithiol-disulfide oxidoreductase (DUF899 family)